MDIQASCSVCRPDRIAGRLAARSASGVKKFGRVI